MARPMYERENDLDKEREVAEHLSKLWGYLTSRYFIRVKNSP